MIPAKLEELAKEWVEAHKDKIEKYVVREDEGRLSFLAMTKDPQFDWDMEDDLTDLDIKLVNDHDINVHVMLLPRVSDEAFSEFSEMMGSGEQD